MSDEQDLEIIDIELFWYPPDKEYVVRLKQQPGVSALAKTVSKALKEFGEVMPMIIEIEGMRSLTRSADKS